MTPQTLHRGAITVRAALDRLSPRQKQYAMLVTIMAGGISLLTVVFALSDDGRRPGPKPVSGGPPERITNIGVMSPGQQVNPVDEWVGTAGSKLAQYESERDEQTRLNKDRLAFENRTMQRFSELEQRLLAASNGAPSPTSGPANSAQAMPPPGALPLPPPRPINLQSPSISAGGAMPAGLPPLPPSQPLPAAATSPFPA